MSYSPSDGAATTTHRFAPWAFYGVLFGILGALSILAWGPIGVSGTYPRFVGEILDVVAPSYAASNEYVQKVGHLFAKGETFLVIGLFFGGLLGARLNREKAPACEMVHPSEKTTARRYRDAFIGGFLIVFGARIAGGCTSGHIISGITQLSISGFIFAAGVFATGIFTAKTLKGRHQATRS